MFIARIINNYLSNILMENIFIYINIYIYIYYIFWIIIIKSISWNTNKNWVFNVWQYLKRIMLWRVLSQRRLKEMKRFTALLMLLVNFNLKRIARRIENRIGREIESDWTRARKIDWVWNFIIIQERL